MLQGSGRLLSCNIFMSDKIMTKYVSKDNLEQYDTILKSYLGTTLDNIISEKVMSDEEIDTELNKYN